MNQGDLTPDGPEAAARTGPESRLRPEGDKKRAAPECRPFDIWQKQSALDGFLSFFLGANADRFLDREDEDFSIADFAGFGGFDNGFDGLLDQ